jgi:hypothetical protein
MPGQIDTGGRPLLMTQEMLQVIMAGSELPDNAMHELDKNQHLMIEDHKDAPIKNGQHMRAAQRFREQLEHNYPGITNLMKNLPNSRDLQASPEGRRRLLLAGMAHWMRSHGQNPIIATDNEGMLEYFDAQGFETWESRELESKMQKDMGLDETGRPKSELDPENLDQAYQSASDLDTRRMKTQQIKKELAKQVKSPNVEQGSSEQSDVTKSKTKPSMDFNDM